MSTKRTEGRWYASGRWVAAGLLIFIAVFVVAGGWAAVARISGAVIAPGVISPESGIQIVQHPYGGVIERILVREGQKVRAGELLVVLEDETLKTSLQIAERQLHGDLAEMGRLEAESAERTEIAFDPRLVAARNRPQVRRAMDNQLALFEARRRMLEEQARIHRRQIEALERLVAGLEAELVATERQMRLVREEAEMVRTLLKKGQAPRTRLLALQSKAAALAGKRGRLIGEIARTRQNILETALKITLLRKDRLSRVRERMTTLQTEIDTLEAKVAELREKVRRTRITAPVAGRVLQLRVRTIGGVIEPRGAVLSIVPSEAPLLIEARVRPVDIDQVHPGQQVNVVFTALSARDTPTLQGTVEVVSPAPVTESAAPGRRPGRGLSPPPEPHYLVRVKVTQDELARLGEAGRIVPGMPVEVFIRTGARTPLAMLMQPLTDATRRAVAAEP